jgi:hypothetical protein
VVTVGIIGIWVDRPELYSSASIPGPTAIPSFLKASAAIDSKVAAGISVRVNLFIFVFA